MDFFFIASVHSFFFTLFENLVLINRRDGLRYQRVLALCVCCCCCCFSKGNTEGTHSSEKKKV